MRLYIVVPLILLFVDVSAAPAQQHAGKVGQPDLASSSSPSIAPPSGRRLRQLAPADGSVPILIGATINAKSFGTISETILNREFAFITPGNDFKQSAIHPEPEIWKWEKADDWIKRCRANNQIMRLHSAISPQCSRWAKDDNRTAEELKQNLEEYVTALCTRYNDETHVRWMDVVNETVSRDGEWFGPREGNEKWENPWTQIGFDESHPLRPPLYIKQAFQLANEHAPDIKQIINQHGGMEESMWKKVASTVLYLRGNGLRVDGIGWQAHIDTGWEKDAANMKRLNALINWAHSNDLSFHVTENTVWMKGEYENDYDAQAETFRAILGTLIDHSDRGVVSWNAWQIRDSETERAHLKGCLFHEDGTPKKAYYAIQEELGK